MWKTYLSSAIPPTLVIFFPLLMEYMDALLWATVPSFHPIRALLTRKKDCIPRCSLFFVELHT